MNCFKSFCEKFLLIFYQFFSVIILPILIIIILLRKSKNKEHPTRFLERFAITKIFTPNNFKSENSKLIWIHTVSVGESNSAWVLIDEILNYSPNINILLTSTTTTSAKIIGDKIQQNPFYTQRVIHQFLPIDSYFIIKKFLKYWRFRCIILVESEIWPNIISLSKKSGVLCFLVNARMSEKSARNWQKLRKLGFNIFDYFSLIFVQSSKDKNIFSNLTNNNILYEGNLKIQSKKPSVNENEVSKLMQNIGSRPIFLATSTHEGEEEIVIKTHHKLKKHFPDLLTIIALRHPARSKKVIELFTSQKFAIRSLNEKIENDHEFYLVDSFGELGNFYKIADFAFIGGSLSKVGGHNPIEAIQLDCAVISGDNYFNFYDLYQDLHQKNAAIIVKNSEELFEAILKLLQNPTTTLTINQNAQAIINHEVNSSQMILKKIDAILMLKN